MFGQAVLCLSTLYLYSVAAQGECTDLRGRVISHGLHYVPGPDTCTLCICDNGHAKVCKAVLCSPPQDCRSFSVGSTCCEFICLDDVVKPAETTEANVRVAAGGAAVVVLLTVALVIYRVRKQKRRRPPHADDQRSLTSIGYISGSMGYMGGSCETALAAWKPPGNYLPRGEAPPPYDEAVAQCRPDAMRMSTEPAYHRTYPATVETLARPDDAMQCSGHGYINMSRPAHQVLYIANPQNCYNAPLLQPIPQPQDVRDVSHMPHHQLTNNIVGFPNAIRLTGSLGAISNRGLLSVLQREPDHERPHLPVPYSTNLHTSLHRTIPRISTAVDTTVLDTTIGFNRTDRSLHNEIRRSFHKPNENNRHLTDTGRSMPRNLNLASSDIRSIESRFEESRRSRAHSEEQNVGAAEVKAVCKQMPKPGPTEAAPPPHATLPLTVDKPSCVCSYTSSSNAPGVESGEGGEDADDYRSECENCKAANSSRWTTEGGGGAEWSGGGAGTQTLQRRAPPTLPLTPATATLPQPVTKPRTAVGQPSNWENWFNAIPDSDTESEDE